jgi:maleylacetoacetate isomerase
MSEFVLYDFPRSSASFRVRIALGLKGISYRRVSIDLRAGEQRGEEYLDICKAGLVPSLQLPDGEVLTQSLAIMRYLDTVAEPRLFPEDPRLDAKVSAMALAIACDIHPLNNLRVLGYLQDQLGVSDADKTAWYSHWVRAGLLPLEAEVAGHGGLYCIGDNLTAADVCLVPQMANARRFEVDLSDLPNLGAVDERLCQLEPFRSAAPAI